MKNLILTLLVVSAAFGAVFSQNPDSGKAPSPRTDRMTKDGVITNPSGTIQEEFGIGNVKSVKYADNGNVEMVAGDLNAGITATDRPDRCYQLFELHKDIFGLINPREELILRRENPILIEFTQIYDGIKLNISQIFVYINEGGYISGIKGRFYPELRTLSAKPVIGKDQALKTAIKEYKKMYNGQEPISEVIELLFLRDNDSFYLSWRISLSGWRFCIDAIDGRIRRFYDSKKY